MNEEIRKQIKSLQENSELTHVSIDDILIEKIIKEINEFCRKRKIQDYNSNAFYAMIPESIIYARVAAKEGCVVACNENTEISSNGVKFRYKESWFVSYDSQYKTFNIVFVA